MPSRCSLDFRWNVFSVRTSKVQPVFVGLDAAVADWLTGILEDVMSGIARIFGRLYLNDLRFDIFCGLCHVLRLAQIAPVVMVGREGEDIFSGCGQTQIGGDDGKCSVFGELRQNSRRQYVDTGKCERAPLKARADNFFRLIAAAAAPPQVTVFVSE